MKAGHELEFTGVRLDTGETISGSVLLQVKDDDNNHEVFLCPYGGDCDVVEDAKGNITSMDNIRAYKIDPVSLSYKKVNVQKKGSS